MRKYLILALLAAGVAMPALAQRGDGGFRERHPVADSPAAERAPQARPQTRETRPEIRGRALQQRPAGREAGATRPDRAQGREATRGAPQQRAEGNRGWRMGRQQDARPSPPAGVRPVEMRPAQAVPQRQDRSNRGDRRWNDGDRNSDGRTGRPDRDGRNWNGGGDQDRSGDSSRRRNWSDNDGDRRRHGNGRYWNDRDDDWRGWDRHGWRNDKRYDWRSYRQHNRYVYRPGRYYAPYGWHYGYRRFATGIYLDSMLWGSSYWIADPWYYRLPSAYGPYRWVRYYDDVMLVDMRTGYVVDVIYDFFW